MAITFDTENSVQQSGTSSNTSSYTGASGTTLLHNVYWDDTNTGITVTATYNAVSLTAGRLISNTLGSPIIYVAQFYGIGVCDGSAHDIVTTFSETVDGVRINPQSWTGVGTIAAPANTATGNSTAALSTISSASGEVCVSAIGWADIPLSITATATGSDPADPTSILIRQSNNHQMRCGSHYQNGAASVSMGMTLSSTAQWAAVSLALQPSGASIGRRQAQMSYRQRRI